MDTPRPSTIETPTAPIKITDDFMHQLAREDLGFSQDPEYGSDDWFVFENQLSTIRESFARQTRRALNFE